jgi:hypothetical protein
MAVKVACPADTMRSNVRGLPLYQLGLADTIAAQALDDPPTRKWALRNAIDCPGVRIVVEPEESQCRETGSLIADFAVHLWMRCIRSSDAPSAPVFQPPKFI